MTERIFQVLVSFVGALFKVFLLSEGNAMTGAKPALQTEFVDPAHENAVLEALADDAFDFRTIQGLSEATGLSSSQVLAVLEKRADDIRVAAVSDSNGNTLYTLKSRPPKLQERLSEALAFLAGSAR